MADFIDAKDLFYREYEPKLQNRYILIVEGIPAFTIKTAKRPSLEFETVEIETSVFDSCFIWFENFKV